VLLNPKTQVVREIPVEIVKEVPVYIKVIKGGGEAERERERDSASLRHRDRYCVSCVW
jgi:hypothetical protein